MDSLPEQINLLEVLANNPTIAGLTAAFSLIGVGFGLGHWVGGLRHPPPVTTHPINGGLEKHEKALEERDAAIKELEKKKAELATTRKEHRKYQRLRDALLGRDTDLWNLHKTDPYEGYDLDIQSNLPKVVTVMNLKGGVGKTTLATNLAAYFAQTLGKRTLLVDLDFQGSATKTILDLTTGTADLDAQVIPLFESADANVHLMDVVRPIQSPAVNNLWLAACSYPFATIENARLVKWLLQEDTFDPRYLLSKFLYSGAAAKKFDIVIIDAPPRLSLGAINALTSCRTLLIPASPDMLATEAAFNFIKQANALTKTLNPSLQQALIVMNRTANTKLKPGVETRAKEDLEEHIKHWDGIGRLMKTTIPRRAAFANALDRQSLAVLESDNTDPKTHEILKALGEELAEHIGIAT